MSKEVEEAIEGLENGKFTAYSGSTTAIYKIKDIETVLNYISELEKLPNKIRDKIKDLEEKVVDYQCEENRINVYQRKVLEDLLEGE